MRTPTPTLLIVLALAVLTLATLTLFSASGREFLNLEPHGSLSDSIRQGKALVPSFSLSAKEKLEKSRGFQALLSYTDLGFEPPTLAIRKGETIRFTNNSSALLWITSAGYPGEGMCGSAIDTCAPLEPQDFWEFTFAHSGEWTIVNALDKSRSVTVRVR